MPLALVLIRNPDVTYLCHSPFRIFRQPLVSFLEIPERQNYVEHRSDDGIHWNAKAHRWLTNIILTHIAIEWGKGLPTFVHGKNTNNERKTFNVQMVDTNGKDISVDTNIPKDQVNFYRAIQDIGHFACERDFCSFSKSYL